MRLARMRGVAARALTLLAALVLLLAVDAAPASADSLQPPALGSPAAAAHVKANPTFTWSPVARAARYEIQVSQSSVFSGTPVYTATVRGTSATPTAELPLGPLYWRVLTIDGGGAKGLHSETRAFERVLADAPVLSSPSHGTTIGYPDQPAVLSWEPIPGIAKYRVELDDESNFTSAVQYETASAHLSLPDALPSNAPRFWRVQGVTTNNAVTTAWSDVGDLRSFSIGWAATSRPTPLTPVDDIDADVDDFEFSWTDVPGAARYQIQTSTAPDFTASLTSELVHGTRYRPLNTMTQDQYFWRVRALQANGEATRWSTTASFKREWLDTAGLQARPALTLEDHDGLELGDQLEIDRLYFSWTPVRRASYYEISFLDVAASTTKVCKSAHAHFTPYISGAYTGTSASGFGSCAGLIDVAGGFLVPGKTYVVKVRAVEQTPNGATRTTLWSDTAREGEGSAPALQFFRLLEEPSTGTSIGEPAVITGSPSSAGSPRLTWERVAGALTYTVVLARDSSFNSRVGTFNTTNTNFVVNQMLLDNTAGQPYFWFVLPCVENAQGQTVCTLENTAINIPGKYATFNKLGKAVEGLTAEPVQTDTVKLSWQDHATTSPDGGGVKWYEVEVRDASDALVGGTVKTDATGYSPMNDAYPDGQYTWRVRAIDASGTGLAWGDGGSFEMRSSVPVPQEVAPGASLPVLTWQPTSFAASYDVEVYSGTSAAFPNGSKVLSASVNARPYPVYAPTTALPAATYSWRVRQVDAYGNKGAWSTAVLPFTIGGVAPGHVAPANASAAPAPSMVFDWTDVPGAVRYKLETSTTETFAAGLRSVTTTGTSYAPTEDYVGGTVYWWRVSALNAAGDTLAISAPTSFTSQTAPLAPAATAKTAGLEIEASWTKPGTGGVEITAYYVRYRKQNTTAWTETTTAGDVTSLTFGNLEHDTVYEVQVAAHNAVGTGPFSPSATVRTPTVPSAPTNLAVAAAVRTLTATWKAPTANGGMPVTGYVVRIAPTAGGTPVETEVTDLTSQFTDLADSTSYTIDVAAKNEVGRGAFASVQKSTPALPAAPDTTIAGTDNASIATRTASFTFSSTPATGNTFECRLDEEAYETCASPKQYTDLTEGPHTLRVRAKDAYGQYDATPAVRSFTVDLTAPDTTILNKPPAATTQTSAAFTYAGTPGADVARFECKLDAAAYATCDPAGKTYPTISQGTHTFSVRAVDKAGNVDASPDTYTWTVDLTVPNTVIASGPAQNSTVTARTAEFGFTSEPGAKFECKLDAGDYQPCESPAAYADLADGVHTFSVRASDAAGNQDPTPAVRTWTVDATAPDTALAGSGPTGRVKATTAQFAFSSETGAKFECKLDDGAYAACTSPKSYTGLAEGEHTFSVRAIDTPGNVDATPATRTWTVDLTPPDAALESGPSGTVNSADAEFGFSSEPGATFECKLDGGAFAACTSPKSYTGLAAGPHTFSVRALDAAGNVDGTPATRSWTVDVAAPKTVIAAGPAAFNVQSPSFSFSSEAGATFECKLDDGQFEACTSPKAYTGLSEGPHTFAVRARDAAGNVEPAPAQREFKVDLTAPDTKIDSTPPQSTTATTATFTYSGTAGDADRFECKLDSGAFETCPASYTVGVGEHSFAVRAVDAAGNADATPATYAWTVTAPPVTPPPTNTNPPAPNLPPGGTDGPSEQELVTSGLGKLPGSASVRKGARSFAFTLPAGTFPDGTVVSFKLTSGGRTLGAGRVTASAGKPSKVTIKLTAAARKTLKKKRKLKAKLTASATAPGGAKGSRSRTLSLKLKR